jgi:Pyruvate/2-oxoacid:ferredoxin oxidoreductase delta subunit
MFPMATRRSRQVVNIDEDKCNGCGLCVTACAEGAIQVIDGKARLVSETYCDGLGACLGHCPQDAITIETREAAEFDEAAVAAHLKAAAPAVAPSRHAAHQGCPSAQLRGLPRGQAGHACPSARPVALPTATAPEETEATEARSELGHWPVQLSLVPASAPIFRDADLLVAADCVPFAYPDFHRKLLRGRSVVIGCPKLDDVQEYLDKLTEIVADNDVRSVTVAHMEVPCCFGLVRLVEAAVRASGKDLDVNDVTISLQGARSERRLPVHQTV